MKQTSPLQGMDPKRTLGDDELLSLMEENRKRQAGLVASRDQEWQELRGQLPTLKGGPGSGLQRKLQQLEAMGQQAQALDRLYRKFEQQWRLRQSGGITGGLV